MPEEVTNGELYRLMLAHGDVLKEIKTDVKAQNGRVAKNEQAVAVLSERVDALEDTLKSANRDPVARWTAFGSAVGAGLAAAWGWFHR